MPLLPPPVTTPAPAPATKKTAPAKKTAPKKQAAKKPSGSGYLNFAQLEAIALHAGASRNEAVQLAAIAMAESSGHAGAHNTNASTGDNSYGLWQINMLGAMGPERRQAFGIASNDALFNPLTNASAALHMLRTQGWHAWSTYSSGAYQQYLPRAAASIQQASRVNVQSLNYAVKPQGGGGGDTSQLTSTKSLNVTDYLDDPQIAADYGYLAAYMKDPELGPILAKAAKNGWGPNQLLGALSKTKWWKTTSDTARAWQAQQRTDPATAHQRLHQMVGQVQQLAMSTLGGKIDPDRAWQIANTALGSNWSQNQLQFAVGAEFHYNVHKDAYGGAAGQTLGKLKQMGGDWMVPVSNHTLGEWTKGVLQGTYQTNDFESYLKAQAKSLYPTLSAAIDRGVSVRQYLDPYSQLAAQTLEMSPDSIDWMKPKWSKALNTTTPDGHRAPMSLSDWGTYLRKLPEFKKTAGATQSVYELADAMAHTFGEVA
jgi:hypothetical protein